MWRKAVAEKRVPGRELAAFPFRAGSSGLRAGVAIMQV